MSIRVFATAAISSSLAYGAILASKYPLLPFKYRSTSPSVGTHNIRVPNGPKCSVWYPLTKIDVEKCDLNRQPYFREGVIDFVNKKAKSVPNFILSYLTWPSPYYKVDSSIKSKETAKYPVIVFSHGLWGTLEMYSALCAGVASLGFIVVAMEHEDGSALAAWTQDGEIVPTQTPPSGFKYTKANVEAFRRPFLDRRVKELETTCAWLIEKCDQKGERDKENDWDFVRRHANVNHMFLMGHSFGAATVSRASASGELSAQVKRRITGSIILDLWPFPLDEKVLNGGLAHPSLFLNSDVFAKNGEMSYTTRLLEATQRRLPGQVAAYSIPGIAHQSFSDTPYLVPQIIGQKLRFCGELDRNVAYDTIVGAIAHFLSSNVGTTEDPTIHQAREGNLRDAMLAHAQGANGHVDGPRLVDMMPGEMSKE